MDSTALLALFRSEMADAAEPYLWSDADVFSYFDDAQTMFCRLTDGIADATTADVTLIEVIPTTDWVTTHPSILRIRSAIRSDTGRDVEVINRDDMPVRRWYFDGVPAAVKALIIGMEAGKARVFPKSNETVDIHLTVFRLPLTHITAADQDFEIPAEHHQHLLHWVKHRAYMKQDAETFDRTRAEEFEGRFRAYCEQVKREERRKAFKVRTVAYGGI